MNFLKEFRRAMKRSITTRMVVRIWGSTMILFLVIFATAYYSSKKEVIYGIEEHSRNLVQYYAEKFDGKFRRVEAITRMVALNIENRSSLDEEALTTYMSAVIRANGDIYGTCVAFEPGAFDPNRHFFAPYYYSRDGKPAFVQLGTEEYNYFKWDWYGVPRSTGEPAWTEPYYDTGGGETIMITYSAPFFRDGRFRGVATMDISLADLNDDVKGIKTLHSGYAFMISRSGRFISYPDSSKIITARLPEIHPVLSERITSGETGFVELDDPLLGKPSWMIYSPVPATSMYLVIVYPVNEALASVYEFKKKTIWIGLVGLFGLMLIVTLVSRSIARPIMELAAAVRHVGGGKLDFQTPAKVPADEVGELTTAFGKMVEDLNTHIREVRRSTAEKERIASELHIAKEIQESILPSDFWVGHHAGGFGIFARCIPAREVGGDFYDFFMLDREHLGFLVGDVSGKGIPAALFMAISSTLLKSMALRGIPPGECLSRVNELLLPENNAMMFVTVFYCVLNVTTGEVEYASAGHPFPYILRRTGTIPLAGGNGIALGVLEGARYPTGKAILEPGEGLFLNTDGVTEAMNDQGELYEAARLQHALNEIFPASPENTILRVFEQVRNFVGSAEPSDDITALMLTYRGADGQREVRFTLASRLSEIDRLHREFEAAEGNLGLSAGVVHACVLALEEVVTNIIKYGYDDDNEHFIEIRAAVDSAGEVSLTVQDDGRPFDPLYAQEPDTHSPLAERPVGGLGIYIIRKMMDEVRYEHRGGRNTLTLVKHV